MSCTLGFKKRFQVLKGDVEKHCRELLIQISEAEGIEFLTDVVSSNHHIENAPNKTLVQFKAFLRKELQENYKLSFQS